MIVYPAIDMKDGKCVRLTQGRFDQVTVYNEDPVAQARLWQDGGASFLHLVDLDGAREGKQVNFDVIEQISNELTIPIQQGGGIRTLKNVEDAFAIGISRVIIGTAAVSDKEFLKEAVKKYGNNVAVGIDAKDGMVAIDGWAKKSHVSATELSKEVAHMGVSVIIYTDIATDGMLTGPNLKAMEEMVLKSGINVIASGGVAVAKDISNLKSTGVQGVIVGKALYNGNLTLKEALEAAK